MPTSVRNYKKQAQYITFIVMNIAVYKNLKVYRYNEMNIWQQDRRYTINLLVEKQDISVDHNTKKLLSIHEILKN